MGLTFLDRFALLIFPLALGQTDLNLGASVFEIYLEWYEGVSLLGHFSLQSHDLFFMHKEFPCTQGVMIHDIAVTVGADVAVKEHGLKVFNQDVTVLEVCPAFPQGLDLGAEERHACFNGLLDRIVMISLSVLADDLHSVIIAYQLMSPEDAADHPDPSA